MSLCFFAYAIKVTPRLVQGVNIAFLVQYSKINSLVQVNVHAAAKPAVFAGRSPSCKGRWYGNQQGISGPEKFRQREAVQQVKTVAVKR
ncbi:hypothetical protein UYN94_08705 [Escherichia coli]|uniref:hypothetical protein n=1 Tax=Escherichia coli TaxID=562 RepID=UPI0020426C33|nr:hypothetical protein [Escherichia coli]MCM2845636.1 hypothetical protein [Escherichia coli]MDY8263414.1 hypothetical protein [Escherichia coli]MDY8349669.1 hypothetical protein [Escherichia coli]